LQKGNYPEKHISPFADRRNRSPFSRMEAPSTVFLQLLIGIPPCFSFFHRQKGQLELFPFTSYSVFFFILSVLSHFFAQFTVAGGATASTNVANLLIL
jgi:hypothetical protein